MQVFEMTVQIAFSELISYRQISERVGDFIASAGRPGDGNAAGAKQIYEDYTFDQPYPREDGRVYLTGKVYSVHIHTVNEQLAQYWERKLLYHSTETVQGLSAELRIIPRMQICRVYSLTPVMLGKGNRNWREKDGSAAIVSVLEKELIRKYHLTHNDRLQSGVHLIKGVRIENRKPIMMNLKGRILCGDRLDIFPESDAFAQEVFYTVLGTGIGRHTSRGMGFLETRPFRELGENRLFTKK